MRVVGIDPGTATTGYGVIEETAGRLVLVSFGTICTPARQPMPERLLDLHTQLIALLALHAPDTAAVESLFFQKNVRTAISVGQARGAVLLALAERGMPVGEYTPLEVKQAVTGYGGAEKRQVQIMVRTLLGLADLPRPDDAADALAVAICHAHSQKIIRLAEAG
ncbi:MAG: crossover junction endodeoxyribonuclease RuvC [Anaerolineales bacterium]|nr:crossover junction endodeoxyribonuclease RuvC [Anaerolineales bacterium]